MSVRLALLLQSLPPPERTLIYNADENTVLTGLGESILVVSAMKPVVDGFAARGIEAGIAPSGAFDLAIVLLPRAKQLGLAQIEEAARHAPHVIVDGQKTDGVESVLKALKKKASLGATVSKAHGKAALFESSSADLAEWTDPGALTKIDDFATRLGVFSSDKIDAASKLLAQSLPSTLSGSIADFGAGWGYLSRAVLQNEAVKELTLVEADHRAILCAQDNIRDPRARILWDDATQFKAQSRFDTIVMNPPFHTGRAAEPELGQAFIRNAARNLKQTGDLWLVANRQLPYEATLAACFKNCDEISGTKTFKILHASKPFTSPKPQA